MHRRSQADRNKTDPEGHQRHHKNEVSSYRGHNEGNDWGRENRSGQGGRFEDNEDYEPSGRGESCEHGSHSGRFEDNEDFEPSGRDEPKVPSKIKSYECFGRSQGPRSRNHNQHGHSVSHGQERSASVEVP